MFIHSTFVAFDGLKVLIDVQSTDFVAENEWLELYVTLSYWQVSVTTESGWGWLAQNNVGHKK